MPVQHLRYVLVDPFALDPTVFDSQSPGIDLYAPRHVTIEPGGHVKIDTGVTFLFPPDKLGLIWDKSSVAWSKEIVTEAGVIDTGYRGTVNIVLRNMSRETVCVERGQ
ncbi:hypothetical protein JTE90_003915 [Oedothorax gibbosus]|uniref:Deoxyuridine 5'-triphosphate nucleotidohydrolase n=1 Tax=Oedothorax gibbosus TaxID=931172 RepID=A0AAV6TMM2_9ARAC|nr:hypothetical protein JTE90_003915 [Oedothorax gibbosus]